MIEELKYHIGCSEEAVDKINEVIRDVNRRIGSDPYFPRNILVKGKRD